MIWLHRFFTFALVGFIGGILFFAAFMAAGELPVQDLAQYWSAAHLVRQNPYSPHVVSEFQHDNGVFVDPPLVLKNPPWAIPFILPLGLFSYRVDFALWAVFSVVVVSTCSHFTWKELALPSSLSPIILPFVFGPTIVLLMLGQWTVLVLLGITIFLIALHRKQDWIAGASLVLVLGKPHVALLFLIAVVFWIIQERRWIIAWSGSLTLLASSLFVEAINPHIFAQFLGRSTQVVHELESYPNLGGMLYLASGVHALALIPQLAGLVWLGFYWKEHRHNWNWWEQGSLVLLCSVVCSYYSYPYDEILALPALLIASAIGSRRLFLVFFSITNLGYFLYIFGIAGHFGFGYMFLWWTATGWLVTFVISQRANLNVVRVFKPSA
jgi:Glycosyltransferase family 87